MGEQPQCTLHAYQRALEAGVSVEMDVRKTADGDLVVIHDRTTGRTCDQDWVMAEKTVAQLQTLDAAHGFDLRHDKTYPLRGRGITIPTLDEVFTVFVRKHRPGMILWVDAKDDESYAFAENQVVYDRLIELIGKHNLWKEVHVEVSQTKEAEALRWGDEKVERR